MNSDSGIDEALSSNERGGNSEETSSDANTVEVTSIDDYEMDGWNGEGGRTEKEPSNWAVGGVVREGEGVGVGEGPEDMIERGATMPWGKHHSLSRYEGNLTIKKTDAMLESYSPAPYTSAPPSFASNRDKARIEDLEEEVRSLKSQLETVLAHSVCAGWEIRSLQERLNLKNNRTKKRKVQVNAHYVSSAEASQMLDEQERADTKKRLKEEEVQAAKKAKDDQRKHLCEAGGITFSGSLNSKTRDDLLDISFALRLTGSDSNTQETKATLIAMISTYLDNNADLASNPTFAGLFLSRIHGCKRNVNDENAAPTPLQSLVLLPPEPPRQPPSTNFAYNPSEPGPNPALVHPSELPHTGRFFKSIHSTPPDFSLPGPSTFLRYPYQLPPIPRTPDPNPRLPPLSPTATCQTPNTHP